MEFCLSCPQQCHGIAHRDTANVQSSANLLVSLGDFTAGQLWLEDAQASVLRIRTCTAAENPWHTLVYKRKPNGFPAHTWHMTESFVGDRWVLTAFTMPECPPELLEPLGFQLQLPSAQAAASVTSSACSGPTAAASGTSSASSKAPVSGSAAACSSSLGLQEVNWSKPVGVRQ